MSRSRDLANLAGDATGLETLTVSDITDLTVGISNGNHLTANANVADDDFLRVDGTSIEGRTAAETLSDIGAAALAGATFTGPITGVDVNGTELVLDADGDTSITADTDDQIDIKIGGTDKARIDSSGIRLLGTDADTSNQVLFNDTGGQEWGIQYDAGALKFSESGVATQVTMTDGGNVTLNTGNLVIGTAGKGITFSSTNTPSQSAGTGSQNILDDYEEGSFDIKGESGNSGWSSSSPLTIGSGHYVKIGKVVHISVSFSTSAQANDSSHQWNGTQWIFSGFPFAVNKASQCAFGQTARTNIHSNATHYWRLETTGKIYSYCMNANLGGPSAVLSQSTGTNFTPNIAFNITYETT